MTTTLLWEGNDIKSFDPIALTRATFDLRCGILSFRERWLTYIDKIDGFIVRDEIAFTLNTILPVNPAISDDTLVINVASFPSESIVERAIKLAPASALIDENDRIIAIRTDNMEHLQSLPSSFATERIPMSVVPKGVVELPILDGEWIVWDFERLAKRGVHGALSQDATLLGDALYIAPDATIEPFTLLDAREGPIYIERGAAVLSHSVITGPAHIGRDAVITNAKIREGCSIGERCKVGGEVEESIFQGFSNKAHEGFVGHSYIGEWVNLGALTTTSDLKNNYGVIKYAVAPGEARATGLIKVGAFIGDHAKTGIGTLINSGSRIGVSANFYGGGIAPKFTPSFLWGSNADGFAHYNMEKALATVKIVKSRRNQQLTADEDRLLRSIHSAEAKERERLIG